MKDISQLPRDFAEMQRKYKKLQTDTPRIAGTIAVKVMRENFAAQGFIEEGAQPSEKWEKRDEKTDHGYDTYKTYKGSVYSSSNPILKQTGNLRDAIAYKVEGENKVFIGVDINKVPYAQAHNEGWGDMPKRKFLGWSKKLGEEIKKRITKERSIIFSIWALKTGSR
jgi:phage gpG-like protein